MSLKIPFISLSEMHQECKAEIFNAFSKVYESNQFILGKEVTKFEESYAKFNHTK